MGQDVRQADIAKKLGVSIVSVSRALSGKEGVGEGLRDSILSVACDMGYVAKEQKNAKENMSAVGVLIAEHYLRFEHSFFLALNLHLTQALSDLGVLSYLKVVQSHCADDGMDIPDNVSGLVVVGKLPEDCLKFLEETTLPLVYLDFYAPDSRAVSVLADGYLGGWDITRHLLKCGHRNIGYLGSIDSDYNAQDRYYGYCKALAEEGLAPQAQWVIPNRAREGFFENYILPKPLPSAFVCDCDQSAYQFTRDLVRQGYRVPDDVSVTGFYNHVFSTLITPALTTYAIDKAQMGRKAAEAITMLLKGESMARRITVSGGLVLRDSVKMLYSEAT